MVGLKKAIDTKLDTDNIPNLEPYSDANETKKEMINIENVVTYRGHVLNQQLAYDTLISAEVILYNEANRQIQGQVKRYALDYEGWTSGTYNNNLLLNTIVYEVELADGQVKEYLANVITNNILSQVNNDSFSTSILKGTINH